MSIPNGFKRPGPSKLVNQHGAKKIKFTDDADEEACLSPAITINNSLPLPKHSAKGKEKAPNQDALRNRAQSLKSDRMNLPVWNGRHGILHAVDKNDTIIVLGETGSGKTTQIPQFLLDSSVPRQNPKIAVTQPRRVAAITLATRVAEEAASALGGVVGYTVRFDDCSSPATRLKYVTDGTLLQEMLGDPLLQKYDVIIVDEAHERSLRTDMLLGFLKGIQKTRKEKKEFSSLKVVVMSATLDAQRFSDFFNKAPIVYVKGRQHKVSIMYSPEPITDYIEAALKTIYDIHLHKMPGDILVFLSGQEEIENLKMEIEGYGAALAKEFPSKSKLKVCPLYAKLSPQVQAEAFKTAKPNERKIILSTNIAETSVTIPGVKYVVDSGVAKEKQHHPQTGIEALRLEDISQSSAMQRAGRAGREGPGHCFRLYTEESFLKMKPAAMPEIQRCSLAFALLHMRALKIDIVDFEFMDRPENEALRQAARTLVSLGAITQQTQITTLGQQMAKLPLDPPYARILLESFEQQCPSEIIDILSIMSQIDNVLSTSSQNREAATEARSKFMHRDGDHLTWLRILRSYQDTPDSDKNQWCKDHYISKRAMTQVLDTRKQLRQRCERQGLEWDVSCGDETEPVLSSLMVGLPMNIAFMGSDGQLKIINRKKDVRIHPASVLHGKKMVAVVFSEIVHTTATYIRGCSAIQPHWIKDKIPIYNNRALGESQVNGKAQTNGH